MRIFFVDMTRLHSNTYGKTRELEQLKQFWAEKRIKREKCSIQFQYLLYSSSNQACMELVERSMNKIENQEIVSQKYDHLIFDKGAK